MKRRWSEAGSPIGFNHRDRLHHKRWRSGDDGGGTRRWVSSPRDLSSFNDRFVIVSYNILSVENVSKHSDLYRQVAPQHLTWDQRKKNLHRELNRYNASILCFQEVDRFDELDDLLHKNGYAGVYKRRTGEASDGCAIFWKEEQFTLLHQESIEFQKFGLRDNVAQLCLFKVHSKYSPVSTSEDSNSKLAGSMPSRTLLVGNIHALFNPKRGDIKLGQIRMLLERAHALSHEWGNSSVVISGDLNSTPRSALYQFISSSELDILTCDRKKISGQVELSATQRHFTTQSAVSRSARYTSRLVKYKWSEEEIFLATGRRGSSSLQNPLKLSSAYLGVPGKYEARDTSGEPLATSYHSKFMGTVDYIWHSAALVPVRVLETLPINMLRLEGLPSKGKWCTSEGKVSKGHNDSDIIATIFEAQNAVSIGFLVLYVGMRLT